MYLFAEFMQLWEGFETDLESNVVVLGATNKKFSLDDAVLRRFSLQYEVSLPTVGQREEILRSILKRYSMEDGAHGIEAELLDSIYSEAIANGDDKNRSSRNKKPHPLRDIAEKTEGFSGSDLKEMCSQAAAIPVHKFLSEAQASAANGPQDAGLQSMQGPEPLAKVHFEQVLEHMVPPSRAAQMTASRRNSGNSSSNSRQLSREALITTLEPLIESLTRNGV